MASELIPAGYAQLLYVKSKAYIHPTTSSKDNVAGFLSLSKLPNSSHTDILLSFTPETILSDENLAVLNNVDMSSYPLTSQFLIRESQLSSFASYCFSIPLSNVYSIQARNPSLGWWWGSFIINSKSGEKLPIVFFHDDESPSTIKNQSFNNKTFNPFNSEGELFWGGDDFLRILKDFVVLEKSLEKSIYLVNPDSNDLRNFTPLNMISATDKNEKFNFNKFLNSAKWKVLEGIASLTQKTKNTVKDVIDDQTPEQIKKLLKKPEVQRIGDEFDSARVYLAKWAMQVQEEAESSKSTVFISDNLTKKINNELGEEILSNDEISKVIRRKDLTRVEWESFFDHSGRLSITVNEVKERIFHGGLNERVRPEAWLFLLNIYPWDSSTEERRAIVLSYRSRYEELKNQWLKDETKENDSFWKDQKFRIEKDINRTDRSLPLYRNEGTSQFEESNDDITDSFIDFQNSNLNKLRNILITFNEFNKNLGYVQGMSDLLSPLYFILQDEALTFWAFTKFMDRMERNFLRDQSGMKIQMSTLNELVQFMLPKLYVHLTKCDSNNLFFFFRMLLVWFKREFEYDDVMKLWEVFFTDYYSSQFHLFFALAILAKYEKIIENHLTAFDEVLKYMNDLSMTLSLDDLLIRAELLFLRFRRMIDIIDRERSSLNNRGESQVSPVSSELRQLLSKIIVIQKEEERPEGVGGG